METVFDNLNKSIFNSINHFAGNNVILDKTAIIIAEYLPVIFIFILIYYWLKNNGLRNSILYCFYSAILGLILNYIITLFYFHPRPFMDKIGIILIQHVPETSFPSDHTTFMTSTALMLLYFKNTRFLGILLLSLSLIGGTARVFTGIHYPFDIMGSFLVAGISSFIIFQSQSKLIQINKVIESIYVKIENYLLRKNINKK